MRRIGDFSRRLTFSALKLINIYLFSVLQSTPASRYYFLNSRRKMRAALSFTGETVALRREASLSSQTSHTRHSEDPMPGPVL